MTRLQHQILNATAAILVALFIAHFFAARATHRLGADLARQRNAIVSARQVETILQQLTQRIAKGAETDPRLTALLPKPASPAAHPPPASPPRK